MTNWPGNQGSQGGFGGSNPIGGNQPPSAGAWQQPPTYQQGWSAPPPGPPGPVGPPQFGMPPQPPKNRKPLIITLIAGGTVLLVAAIVGVIVLASGNDGGKSGSAGDVVKGYLEALARGDAEEALSYGAGEPGSKEFLTDEILKKQIDKMPITNIKILSDDSGSGISLGQVHVSVSFGDKVSDETLMLKRSGKQWRLDNASVKLEKLSGGSSDKSMKSLTLFGKPMPDSAVYVFPGWLDIGTSNPNLEVTSSPVLMDGLSGYASLSSANIEIDISATGEKAADKAVRDAIAKCVASTQLRPPNCPNGVNEPGALEASWGAPDLSELEVNNFSKYSLESSFSGGYQDFPVTLKMSDGGTKSGTISNSIYGDVDMSQNPPAVSFR